jgi:hypothetical protein
MPEIFHHGSIIISPVVLHGLECLPLSMGITQPEVVLKCSAEDLDPRGKKQLNRNNYIMSSFFTGEIKSRRKKWI